MSTESTTIIATAIENTSTVIETKLIEISDTAPTTIFSFPGRPTIRTTGSNAISIFNPITVDNVGNYGKPNAIVRPVIRRYESTNEMTLPQTNEINLPVSGQHTTIVQDSPVKYKRKEIDTFARELDIKLKYLQKDKKSSTNVKKMLQISLLSFIHSFFYLFIILCGL